MAFYYFRVKISSESVTKEPSSRHGKPNEPNDTQHDKFLFVYQSEVMKRLYRRYAPHLVLLDATYKTMKYALSLYFLVVKENVNYQVSSM